jgi:hypothetical protein
MCADVVLPCHARLTTPNYERQAGILIRRPIGPA